MPRYLPAFEFRLFPRPLGLAGLLLGAFAAMAGTSNAATPPAPPHPLAGTWTLQDAYDLLPDGQRGEPYGPHPSGLLLVTADGRYSLQIFHTTRTPFADKDKARGSDAEMRAAVMGMSTHFGRIDIDGAANTLTFRIEHAAFPNWDGQAQTRPFELKGDILSYHVPKTPTGAIPVSVWRRISF
jgi:hypothetical protein